MKMVYRILGYVIAAEVVIQAMSIVYGIFGLGKWVEGGGVFDKSVMESEATPFPEVLGFAIHGMNGTMVIPVLGLLFLLASFFTRIRGAVTWAAVVLLLIVVQVALGLFGGGIPALGALHGLVALLLLGAAVYAARLGRSRTRSRDAVAGDRVEARA